MSRRVLYDLLEKYAGIAEYTLSGSIDKFVGNTTHPSEIRGNLHYLRELGDFGAHTKKDGDDRIINITRDEAEWCLKVVERLFDYFIVGPEINKKLRADMDRKLEEAGRKPIKPLPPDPEVPSQ
jgi:hypothetical protein